MKKLKRISFLDVPSAKQIFLKLQRIRFVALRGLFHLASDLRVEMDGCRKVFAGVREYTK